MKNDKKIGVFDSGIGGLTVLSEMIDIMPNEQFIYIGDLLNSPYGDKTPTQIENFSRKIINFLIENSVKAIVVACNTASSYNLDQIRKETSVPIFSVLEAGSLGILDSEKKVLLSATNATVKADVYDKKIYERFSDIKLYKEACPELVPIVESGCMYEKEIQKTVDGYISKYRDMDLDLLILGCTHYPILEKYFSNSIGSNVRILNPAKIVAKECFDYLNENILLTSGENPSIEFLVTHNLEKFDQNIKSIFPKIKNYKLAKISL